MAPRSSVLLCSLLCLCAWPASAQPAPLGEGFTVVASPQHAAFPTHGAPTVIVHAPPGFDAHAKLDLVVFLHGYSGCVSVLMGHGPSRCSPTSEPQPGWDLGARHDDAHTNTLFIVPQLAFMKRSGRAGAFARDGVFRAFLEELLRDTLVKELGGSRTLADVASLTLVAHSAGYETTLAILQHGRVSELVRSVVLFDALYGEADAYADYIEAHAGSGLRVIALHLGGAATYRNDRHLYRRLKRRLGTERVAWTATQPELEAALAALAEHPIVIGAATPPHRLVPEHHLAQVLRALRPPPSAAR